MIDPRIEKAFLSGHARNPDYPDTLNVTYRDLETLTTSDSVVRQMFESWSRFDANYPDLVQAIHGRAPEYDGDIDTGGAVAALAAMERCGYPDYPLSPTDLPNFVQDAKYPLAEIIHGERPDSRAVGTGNWPMCHNVGNYHAAVCLVDQSGMGNHLKPVFTQMLRESQECFRELGFLPIWVDRPTRRDLVTGNPWSGGSRHELTARFVQRSNGWIGLAQVANGMTCGDDLWAQFLATYRPANVLNEWRTLWKHEFIHTLGEGHTRGGVENPSIVRGLPLHITRDDPIYPKLTRKFGGERVPQQPWEIEGPGPQPPPTGDIYWVRGRSDGGLEIIEGRDKVVSIVDFARRVT